MSLPRSATSLLLVALFACGGGSSSPTTPTSPGGNNGSGGSTTPVATSVVLSATSVSLTALGASQTLSATVKDQNGATMSGAGVSWISSDTQVASVSSGGVVTAVSNGTATITAGSGSASSAATVTVAQRAATLVVTPADLSFTYAGETAQATATAADANGNAMAGAAPTWTSSDAGVAKVDANGWVTAVADGTATISASLDDGAGQASAKVQLQLTGHAANKVSVPVGGNAWFVGATGFENIASDGADSWSTPGSSVRTYFYVEQAGTLIVSATIAGPGADARLTLSIGGVDRTLMVSGSDEKEYFAGQFTVPGPGYVAVDLKGDTRSGDTFGRPTMINVSGSAVTNALAFVPSDDNNGFYFGRRGPSTHWFWNSPGGNIRWLYSEVTVPAGNDLQGAYFMANGFDQGYFGMQVNGPDARQFIFSIWSPYKTDDPSSIPDAYKILTIRKGDGVVTGEFGNEGAGGKSTMQFPWKAGTTYRFLTQVQPNGDNTTDITSWVYTPEDGAWHLMVQFRRPFTNAYAGSPYSFMENFNPDQGDKTRMAFYQNQWIADENGNWQEVLNLTFSVDDTGGKGYRRDFAGGIANGIPFLRIDGFFDDGVAAGGIFTRTPSAGPPTVDLTKLP